MQTEEISSVDQVIIRTLCLNVVALYLRWIDDLQMFFTLTSMKKLSESNLLSNGTLL